MVGLGGTGKGSVVKLAAYLQNCEFRTLRTFSNYNTGDFHEDVKDALYAAGVDGYDTVLFLNDRYLVKVGNFATYTVSEIGKWLFQFSVIILNHCFRLSISPHLI